MPIYEFKCSACQELFELLVMQKEGEVDLKCPHCRSEEFERVLSSTNYAMGAGGSSGGVRSRSRTCQGGSCTTYEIPGPTG
jgi:putative FmdB family regulatory protein